jgi:hypothetical protein
MAPTRIEKVVYEWTCRRCGRVEAHEGSAGEPPAFTNRASITLTTVGRDFQGGIVGPGTGVEGDLCNECAGALIDWLNLPAEVPSDDDKHWWRISAEFCTENPLQAALDALSLARAMVRDIGRQQPAAKAGLPVVVSVGAVTVEPSRQIYFDGDSTAVARTAKWAGAHDDA